MGGKKSSPKPPQLQAPREVPLSETFAKFLGQEAQLPALSSFASNLNRDFRASLEQGLPGSIGATQQTSNLVNQLLSGVPSADVQSVAQRQLAERNAAAGISPTSEAAIFGEAAAYGRTAMDLQAQGMSLMPGLLQMSEFLSPQQAQNYLFSTGQLRGEDLKASQDAANVANQNAINKYNYDVQNAKSSGGIFGTIGGLLGAAAGSVIMPGAGTAIGGMIGGGLGNLAGGGGFQLGAGQAGGAISSMGQLGSSLFGGGLLGGGGGAASIPSMGLGSVPATTPMSFQSYGAPFTMADMQIRPSSPGLFGGVNPYSYTQQFPTP
jgi:hypothetical protein